MKILQGLLALCLAAAAMANSRLNALQQVAIAANHFSIDFFKHAARKFDENVVCFPLGTHIILAMAAYGSAGNTEEEFNRVLHLPQPPEDGRSGYQLLISVLNNVRNVDLEIANEVFINPTYPTKQSYKEIVQDDFHSDTRKLNFTNPEQAATTINNWIAQSTNNKIQSIVQSDELDSDTAILFVNAVYFKGNWQVPFDKDPDRHMTFHLDTSNAISVPSMYKQSSYKIGDVPGLNAKFIELPYESNQLKMIIYVPNEIGGLPEMERKLGQVNLNTLLADAQATTIGLRLPKFKVESKLLLNSVLQRMGLVDMFISGVANFSGISDVPMYVSKVLQKAIIEVDEQGTNVGSGSRAKVERHLVRFVARDVEELTVDRPFIVSVIKVDNRHSPANLLMARVVRPQS